MTRLALISQELLIRMSASDLSLLSVICCHEHHSEQKISIIIHACHNLCSFEKHEGIEKSANAQWLQALSISCFCRTGVLMENAISWNSFFPSNL